MSLADLFFLFSAAVVALGLLGLLIALLTRRWALLRGLALGLLIYIGVYAILLVAASLLSPQRTVALGELRCFDDWCVTVEQAQAQEAIGETVAKGAFYLVAVQVSNHARGRSQRESDATIYVLDESGNRYVPDARGEGALQAGGGAGQPLDSRLAVGGTFEHTAVFDLPAGHRAASVGIAHGAFPGAIIIGGDESWLHKPVLVPLP
jgi:hypothetical protein